MRIVVEKYGGSSVKSIERIKNIAQKIVKRQENGYKMVVVVSAMGNTTDNLVYMGKQIASTPRERELGMLLSTGEIVTSSLLAMAIQALGKKATSLTGAQGGIFTDREYANAKITNIDTSRIKKLLCQGEIIVMAGYQGKVGDEVTVLGRGGSDASAVALAAALNAEHCHIFSDVQGVFTADPRIVNNASLLHGISYEEMIELAASGAKIMMGRSVEIARKYNLRIKVSSSFNNSPGTLITREDELEKVTITGISANKEVALVNIYGVKNDSNYMPKILKQITSQQINIILLNSNNSEYCGSNISMIIKLDDINAITKILEEFCKQTFIKSYIIKEDVGQVAIVGSGIATNYGVAYEMYDVLSKNGIEVLMTSTSEIKITAIIPRSQAYNAVIKLHERFKLNNLKRNYLEIQNG